MAKGITCALALGAALSAQVFVPDNTPATGPINYVPLGGKGPTGAFQNMRAQIRVPASFLPAAGSQVTDLAFAPAATGGYAYATLEVRLAHLPGAFSTTFASNLAGPALVLAKTGAQVAGTQDQWSWLGLTQSFAHDGTRDLVVDVIVQGAVCLAAAAGSHRTGTLETVFETDYFLTSPVPDGGGPYLSGAKLALTLAGGNVVVIGQGCPKADAKPVTMSYAGSAKLNLTLSVLAGAATPSSTLALLVGTSEQSFGTMTLPWDLASIGAAGCLLRTDIALALPVPADAAGSATFRVTIPGSAALQGKSVLFQWLAPAPQANALGAVLSALLRAGIQ